MPITTPTQTPPSSPTLGAFAPQPPATLPPSQPTAPPSASRTSGAAAQALVIQSNARAYEVNAQIDKDAHNKRVDEWAQQIASADEWARPQEKFINDAATELKKAIKPSADTLKLAGLGLNAVPLNDVFSAAFGTI